jgi:hypothetical protein
VSVDDDLEALARDTPAGRVDLPLVVVGLAEGARAAADVDPAWLDAMDRRRTALRDAVVAAGRGEELETALHEAILEATERFDPSDDADVDTHVASGARLWLLTGAVVSALSGADPDPFAAWGRLVEAGWWPVGPSGGRLILSRAE